MVVFYQHLVIDFDCIFVFIRNQLIGKSDEYLLTIDRTRNRTTTKKEKKEGKRKKNSSQTKKNKETKQFRFHTLG